MSQETPGNIGGLDRVAILKTSIEVSTLYFGFEFYPYAVYYKGE